MKIPTSMDLEGVPLRRILKLIAERLGMEYGIKDGMVTLTVPNMLRRNWQDLLVMEESFPQSSPVELEGRTRSPRRTHDDRTGPIE